MMFVESRFWIFTILLVDVGVSITTLTPNLVGELCSGQDVVLTCSTTDQEAILMAWFYNGVEIRRSHFVEFHDIQPIGFNKSFEASGFMFSGELISKRPMDPVFASTLSFSADTAMNGDIVSCRVSGLLSNHTIHVQGGMLPSPPTDVRLTSTMSNSESASVTIEWDPPSQGGSPLNYTITTTPDLISGPPPVTTFTTFTRTTLTIDHNTNYTVTVTASNCLGNGVTSDRLQFNIGISSSLVSTTVLVILVVVFFIVGVLGGFTGGVLIIYGSFKWKLSHQSKHDFPPTSSQPPPAPVPSQPPPDPLYEDIEMIATSKYEVNENVAYGITIASQVT